MGDKKRFCFTKTPKEKYEFNCFSVLYPPLDRAIRVWLRHDSGMSLAYGGAMSIDMSGYMRPHARR